MKGIEAFDEHPLDCGFSEIPSEKRSHRSQRYLVDDILPQPFFFPFAHSLGPYFSRLSLTPRICFDLQSVHQHLYLDLPLNIPVHPNSHRIISTVPSHGPLRAHRIPKCQALNHHNTAKGPSNTDRLYCSFSLVQLFCIFGVRK